MLSFQVALSLPPSGGFPRLIKVSNQAPKFSSTNQDGNKKGSLDYKLAELLIYLKRTTYSRNICNIYCVDRCIS